MLMFNNSKTEFFLAASPHNLAKLHNVPLQIGDNKISPSSKKKKQLRCYLLSNHVDEGSREHYCQNFNCQLSSQEDLYRICRFITIDSCHQLVRSLILSHLDYANSPLYGIAAKDRRKLQKLQNKASKVIFRCDRLHPSAPLRKELHWLPINESVIFKVLLLTFKGVKNLIPAYLSDFVIKYVSGRENLRSGNEHLLCVSRTKRAIGDLFILCCWTAPLEFPPFPYSFFTFSQRFQKVP